MKKVLDNYDPYVILEKQKKIAKKYSQTEKGKLANKKGQLKSKYNLSIEEYNNKLKNQNHKCAICGIDEIDLSSKLAVDHDHVTKKIRDLLCINCNTGLGQFKDNVDFLFKAISYLEDHK